MTRLREIATACGLAFAGLLAAVVIALREIDRATSFPARPRTPAPIPSHPKTRPTGVPR